MKKIIAFILLSALAAPAALAQTVNTTVNTAPFTVSTNQALGLNFALRQFNREHTNKFTLTIIGETVTTNYNAALSRQEYVRMILTNAFDSFTAARAQDASERQQASQIVGDADDALQVELLAVLQRFASASPAQRTNALNALP